MKRLKYLLMLLIPTISYSVNAEPSPKVRYLMNESMSMWDWGFYRIREDLSDLKLPNNKAMYTDVEYDWKSDRIKIFASAKNMLPAKDAAEAKEWCKHSIQVVRVSLGQIRFGDINSSLYNFYERYFSHEGYRDKNEPEELADELGSIVYIDAAFRFKSQVKNNVIRCQGYLMKNEILFSETDKKSVD